MKELEKKVDALIRLCTAENETAAGAAREELCSMVAPIQEPATAASVQSRTRTLLRELGVPEHLTGYLYLVEAVVLAVQEPGYLRRVTSGLYPAVAKICDTTPSRAERAMRHAIETAWSRCDLDTLFHYFGNTVSPVRGKPVNSEFIARVSNAVRLGE